MGTTLTDAMAVALVDSVTGWAFGTVFDSTDHAEDFLRWLAEKPRAKVVAPFPPSSFKDPRVYENNVLEQLIRDWRSERVDDDGALRPLLESV